MKAKDPRIETKDQPSMECPKRQPVEGQGWDSAHLRRIQEHPCYSPRAVHSFGRIHLPVAPKCNIQCNYCIRDFDCVNESRPGVTSRVISPREALDRVSEVVEKFPNIRVVGIAGPGEPLSNEETFETFRLVRGRFPDLHHCVSSNGLLLVEKLEPLNKAGVTNITVTLNALSPEIGEKIYSFVHYHGKTYRGREGAQILLENQLRGIEGAVKNDMTVKINTVLIPGVNDRHAADIARKAKDLGAFVHNIMPLIPQHLFANVRPPSPEERKSIQDECATIIPQMRHCRQCRADAMGKLGEDHPLSLLENRKSRVAICTRGATGVVDLHFGHTTGFSVYEVETKNLSVQFLEERKVGQAYCKGPECDLVDGQEAALRHITDLLKDCTFLLTRRIGPTAEASLKKAGIVPVISADTIEDAIKKIFIKDEPGW